MNTLSSHGVSRTGGTPVSALEYRDVAGIHEALPEDVEKRSKGGPKAQASTHISFSGEELAERVQQARLEATALAEERARKEFGRQLEQERSRLAELIASFQQERAEYYAHVEPEIVQLILAVARKILHREAQIDRMLLAALAKLAVENLQQRSHVVLRVAPESCGDWRDYFADHLPGTKVEILEDSQLGSCDCVLDTDLGRADLGIDAQLKEIERGFLDLLAKRPETR